MSATVERQLSVCRRALKLYTKPVRADRVDWALALGWLIGRSVRFLASALYACGITSRVSVWRLETRYISNLSNWSLTWRTGIRSLGVVLNWVHSWRSGVSLISSLLILKAPLNGCTQRQITVAACAVYLLDALICTRQTAQLDSLCQPNSARQVSTSLKPIKVRTLLGSANDWPWPSPSWLCELSAAWN